MIRMRDQVYNKYKSTMNPYTAGNDESTRLRKVYKPKISHMDMGEVISNN